MVDLAVAAEFLVAIGTIALAAASYSSVQQNKKQLKVMSEQFVMTKSQQAPILKLDDFKFEGNKLTLTVENIGGGPAIWLGLMTRFIPAKKSILDNQKDGAVLDPPHLLEAVMQKTQLYWRYDLIHPKPKLVYENETVGWESSVSFLINPKTNDPTLFPNEKQTMTIEPTFLITAKKAFLAAPFDYEKLKTLLTSNGVKYAALDFDVVAKDSTDRLARGRSIGTFVADFERHATLEAAAKENHTPYFVAIPPETFFKIGWMKSDEYETNKRGESVSPV